MTKTATVKTETTGIHHTGRGCKLPPGTYEVVDIDGAPPGVAYVQGPEGGALVCVNRHDTRITFGEAL